MFSLVHYVLLLEKLCIAQNGFMKVSGTYFISEFNNFFPVQHIFFFRENSFTDNFFLYLFILIISQKKMQQNVYVKNVKNNINMQLLSNLISDP